MENNLQNFTLGFLDLVITEEKERNGVILEKFFGAILITDCNGIPQEFRCTHPVRPSMVQKQLYGTMLLKYISTTLCGLPLLQSLSNKPSILIIQKEYFLDVRESMDIPLIYIKTSGEILDIQSASDNSDVLFSEMLKIKNEKLKPIKLYVKNKFQNDLKNNIDNLNNIFTKIDPLEPFDRILKALDMISSQDERFK